MRGIKLFLERWGLHAFLLPVFFVLHNYKQYYGLVSANVALKLLFEILLFSLLAALLLLAVTKHINKSLQLTTLAALILLFFGAIKDFLQQTLRAHFISRYSILLPLVVIGTVFLVRLTVKKRDFRKANLFQNVLLLLFIFIDGLVLITFDHSSFLHKNLLIKTHLPALQHLPDTASKPDVYYLVFDSYPGTTFLRDYMEFDNSPFNQALEKKGFHVIKNPKSNYNQTPFSIASTLNFEYLENRNHAIVSPKDYAEANLTIKQSIVPKIFQQYGYRLYNLSIFDIDEVPAIRKETFLTMPEQNILLYNTLTERVKNDILWNLIVGKFAVGFVQRFFVKSGKEFRREQEQKNDFNKIIVDSLMEIAVHNNNAPKFVYAHLYLPHPPFFYDETGKKNNIEYIMTEASLEDKQLFLSYLKYTNKIVLKITDQIMHASGNKPIIILQSDHGFRDFKGAANHPELLFKNYSAFYFPDKNYTPIYDTISNINTFPILFNRYFKTEIPLQKDTSIFLSN